MERVQPQLYRSVILWPAVQKVLKNILIYFSEVPQKQNKYTDLFSVEM